MTASRRAVTASTYSTRSAVTTLTSPLAARTLHTSPAVMTRVKLASKADLPAPGKMKDFVAFGEGDDALKILVTNFKGKLHATSAKW